MQITTHPLQIAQQARAAADPFAQDVALQAALAQVRLGVAGPYQRRLIRDARLSGRI
jgi:hypothetical protein